MIRSASVQVQHGSIKQGAGEYYGKCKQTTEQYHPAASPAGGAFVVALGNGKCGQ